jgi:uncharacterized membrane protein YdjX (TVP38/TMEM64 family)
MNLWKTIDLFITNFLNNAGILAPIVASLLILIESMIPILPLAVFITINFYYMGHIIGFIISHLLTCIGCYLSFILCRTKLKKHFDNMMNKKEHKKLNKMMKVINKLSLEELSILIAIPFTPAFMVNIAAGLSNMNKKKFIIAIIIGKIFLVYFWGFIGTSLIDSFKHPYVLLEIGLFILLAFIISRIVNKKFKLD